MTLIEQEFVIQKCREEYSNLYKKLNNCGGHYPHYEYYSEEEIELDLKRCEELKKMLPKLIEAFNMSLEKAYEQILNYKN